MARRRSCFADVKVSGSKYSALPKFGIVVCVRHPGAIVRGDDPSSSSRAGERWTRRRRHEQAGRAGVSPVSPHLVGTNGAVRFVASSCRRQGAHSRRPLGREANHRVRQNRVVPTPAAWRQAVCEMARPTGPSIDRFATATGARVDRSPRRARHKPSDHRAGKAVCWASPVCCCAVFFACAIRAADRGCRRHPAFPAPS